MVEKPEFSDSLPPCDKMAEAELISRVLGTATSARVSRKQTPEVLQKDADDLISGP